MNAIGFFGLHLITAGSYRGEKLAAQDEGQLQGLLCRRTGF